MSRFDNERKKSGYTENNLKKELKVEEEVEEEEEEEEVEVLNNIMNSNNETTTSANDNKIADVILAMFQIQATLRVSHFLSEKKSDHETLDKFLKKFNKKMDKFIEVWMGKHEKFDLGKNRQVNVYQITKDELFTYLDIVLEFLTGDVVESNVYKLSKYPLKNIMNNKKNIDLMSIRDDIVKNINRMKYRLRLE
jgi:aromatic ring-opening dioxygenase catalytic subunit (LigB family)